MQWISEDPGDPAPSRPRSFSRKSHTKSKTGCQQCRSRRIKCDETHPQCTNCTKYHVTCSYTNDRQLPIPVDEEEVDKTIVLQMLWDRNVPRRDVSNALYTQDDNEELLDHVVSDTDLWMGTPELKCVLRTNAFKWMTEAPHFVHTAMAGAAYHLSYEHPSELKYHAAMTEHFALSFQSLAAQLNEPITRENLDPLIGSVTIHSPVAFSLHSLNDEDEVIFGWLRTSRGVFIVLSALERPEWLNEGVWALHSQQTGGLGRDMVLPEDPVLLPWARDLISKFEHLCELSAETDEGPYGAALRQLSKLLSMARFDGTVSALMRFAARLTAEFLDLLEAHDTRALLIFSYWYGLMCNVKKWWVDVPATKGCRWLCNKLSASEDPRVLQLLDWPLLQAGIIATPRY